jgi:hypothetical protein
VTFESSAQFCPARYSSDAPAEAFLDLAARAGAVLAAFLAWFAAFLAVADAVLVFFAAT